MALVHISNIVVDDKPQPFTNPVIMDIYFDVLADIEDEIEWTLLYIGAPKDESYIRSLISSQWDPYPKDLKYKKIPSKEDLLGITAFILTCSYRSREFFRVGYYVYNNYTSPENIENEPSEIIIEDISRQILYNKPRITRFEIDWTSPINAVSLQQPLQTQSYMFSEHQEKQSNDATEIDDHQQIQNVFDS